MMTKMTITNIENLTYDAAKKMAIEELEIKDHNCLIVDFNDCFGYSILVFKNRKHVYFANDYELHHRHMVKEKGKEALRQWYIDTLNNKLFTEEELLENVKTYDEYKRKDNFLRNYWIMRYDYISIFAIGKEEQNAVEKGRKTHPFFNPISFCYVNNKEIVNAAVKYSKYLEKACEKLKANDETFGEMIERELANHEACITCSAEDALNALGLEFDRLTKVQQKIVREELNKQINSYYN